MFDVGFWEIALIGVIALIVVGPDRLPGMARTVGFWVGRARRYVDQVKRDVEREIHAEELREALHGKGEGLEDLYEVVDDTRNAVKEAASDFEDATRDATGLDETARTTDETTDQASDQAAGHPGVAALDAPAALDSPGEGAGAPVPADSAGVEAPDAGESVRPWTAGIHEPGAPAALDEQGAAVGAPAAAKTDAEPR